MPAIKRWLLKPLAVICSIVAVLAVIILSLTLVYKIYHIPSVSMMPTLLPNDYVLVDKRWYNWHEVKKGDVVIFQHPYKDRIYIKRISHVTGERFYGKLFSENEFAVLGDNDDRSEDSRVFGAIKKEQVKGRALFIAFSFDQEGKLRIDRIFQSLANHDMK